MRNMNSINLRRPRLTALCACLAALSPLSNATATTVSVNNCNDSGSGSLREAITDVAESGDTVDMSGLTTANLGCAESRITLTTGALSIPQHDLSLLGPGQDKLTITAFDYSTLTSDNDRVIYHSGTGRLTIDQLTVANGNYTGNSATGTFYGGCIASQGFVVLRSSSVTDCRLGATGGAATSGGGVWAAQGAYAVLSTISGNRATPHGTGGGVASNGPLSLQSSTVSENYATDTGGGVIFSTQATATSSFSYSTISGNTASNSAGGAADVPNGKLTVVQSTISGNAAGNGVSGIAVTAASLNVYNSTIAFNLSASGSSGTYAGLSVQGPPGFLVEVQSTIISNNTVGSTGAADTFIYANADVQGSNNLIYAAGNQSGVTIPLAFATYETCPLLGPLANNGSTTKTHALLSGSPAFSAGSNPLNLTYDQRGQPRESFGAFLRSYADIGAYQMQRADIIFNAGFDGCP